MLIVQTQASPLIAFQVETDACWGLKHHFMESQDSEVYCVYI